MMMWEKHINTKELYTAEVVEYYNDNRITDEPILFLASDVLIEVAKKNLIKAYGKKIGIGITILE